MTNIKNQIIILNELLKILICYKIITFFPLLKDLNRQVEQSNLDPKEIEVAKKGQRKDFPQGIPAFGTDALRFALCSYNFKGKLVYDMICFIIKLNIEIPSLYSPLSYSPLD